MKTLANQVAREIRRNLGNSITVIWFGSWVRGNASPQLDMLRDWIDELPTLFSIDLINLSEASPSIVDEVKHYGINVE